MPTKVDDRGRVLIPKDVRERLGIEAGDAVLVDADDAEVHIRPVLSRREALDRLIGGITERNARAGVGDLDPLDAKGIWEPDP